MHVCMHTYTTYKHRLHTHFNMHACIHACMHTCMYAYMHACMHAYMHTQTHTRIKAFTCRSYMHTDLRTDTACMHEHTYRSSMHAFRYAIYVQRCRSYIHAVIHTYIQMIHTCVLIFMHACTLIRIRIYIHTNMQQ